MCLQFLKDNWEVLSGVTTGAAGILAYVLNRRRELAWKRTEFIFGLVHRLDTEDSLVDAVQVLEARHKTATISALFPTTLTTRSADLDVHAQNMDRLLNLVHSLAHAVETVKTLSVHEIALFGWYIQRICLHDGLRSYCEQNGYSSIIALAKRANLWHPGAKPEDTDGKPEVR